MGEFFAELLDLHCDVELPGCDHRGQFSGLDKASARKRARERGWTLNPNKKGARWGSGFTVCPTCNAKQGPPEEKVEWEEPRARARRRVPHLVLVVNEPEDDEVAGSG